MSSRPGDTREVWCRPWHARLKNLAEGLQPGVTGSTGVVARVATAQGPVTVPATWMGRVRRGVESCQL